MAAGVNNRPHKPTVARAADPNGSLSNEQPTPSLRDGHRDDKSNNPVDGFAGDPDRSSIFWPNWDVAMEWVVCVGIVFLYVSECERRLAEPRDAAAARTLF